MPHPMHTFQVFQKGDPVVLTQPASAEDDFGCEHEVPPGTQGKITGVYPTAAGDNFVYDVEVPSPSEGILWLIYDQCDVHELTPLKDP